MIWDPVGSIEFSKVKSEDTELDRVDYPGAGNQP
jgi:hypothetical protein